ncbi:MAG: class I SAM-dependent DNA methyltransferase [Anaerolineales bacterium]|nr:class I SAM-dependent DNA methyltransferase [Anaerolineales bacterium]
MTFTPQDFVSKWKRVTSREKQTYQEHFIDLCHLVGHQTPNEADPTGMRFAFEMGTAKTSGGQGWADVAKLDYFGWEYKGKDADLDKAYNQLLSYRDALRNPPLLVVSDINNIIIRTNYTNLPTRTFVITLEDMLAPESLEVLKTVFFNPERLKPHETVESVTREAAAQFSRLAENLRRYGDDPQEIAHFLIRLLFCLFAEDIGLLPEKLFPRLLEQTRRNSKDFAEVLRQLFRAMNTGGFFGADKIKYFNGGLFDDDRVLPLDGADMDIIAEIDALDWGAIKPSIFGTLFERGLDPSKRSQLGAHYTGEEDILLIVEPVLMAPLRREWEELQVECRRLKTEADASSGKKRASVIEKIGAKLRAFADKIAALKVLDPACGSGNFLYVALRLLLDLQNEVINFSDELGAGRFFVTVTPAQLYGIETNEYAYELAQMTIQIGYIQWLRDNGYGQPAEPILKQVKNILHMDAILGYQTSEVSPPPPSLRGCSAKTSEVYEPEWPAADVIVGNPPFLGGSKLRRELGDKYVEDLWSLYEGRVDKTADLVAYWFERTWQQIANGKTKRAGLLATQSIRSAINRNVVDKIAKDGSIFLAWSDRPWILDGAAVRVSMIGFDDGTENIKVLDGNSVSKINADLTANADLTIANSLNENKNLSFQGSMIGGSFQIPRNTAEKWLALSNPNGKTNSDVLRPYVTGSDVLRKTSDEWVIDFGDSMPVDEAAGYETPFEYIRKNVYPERVKNPRASRRERWWIHADPQPAMRRAVAKLDRYIATVRVAKHRIFVWLPGSTLCSNKLIVIARNDNYFFGLLHSRVHEVWSLANSSRHGVGNDPAYTPSTCFETFPFPWPPGAEPLGDPRVRAIAGAAQELVEQRERWLGPDPLPGPPPKTTTQTLNADSASTSSYLGEGGRRPGGGGPKRTLTNLYNARPTWLELAHKKLDEAVFAAYGWPSDLSDEEILERLLALNLERAKES